MSNRQALSYLSRINNYSVNFSKIITKIRSNCMLDEFEIEYALTVSLLLLDEYKIKQTKGLSYLELAYYIVLKIAIMHNNYRPLYDVAMGLGMFPITKTIERKGLLKSISFFDMLYDSITDGYYNESGLYYETQNQRIFRNEILSSQASDIAYIAPTSYGKSGLILDHIDLNFNKYQYFVIVVPKKSLLSQVYRDVRLRFRNIKVVLHNEMINEKNLDNKLIFVLTQERALNILNEYNEFSFDVMYIDEAHNLFGDDSRSILLSRLITLNKIRNSICKFIYFSPVINEANNLKINELDYGKMFNRRIVLNMKQPEINLLDKNGKFFNYEKFTNKFIDTGESFNFKEYILYRSKAKNLIYINRPVKIEEFTLEFIKENHEILNDDIIEVIEQLKKFLHPKFYGIKSITKGIIYLHGKVPSLIKEYLEYKYKTISEIKYLIANTVILEGINFPIENMFILNTRNINDKSNLFNLIGRVNRLNYIFTKEKEDLGMLLPEINFLENSNYCSTTTNMKNTIEKFRNREFDDSLENPLLDNYKFKENIKESKKNKVNEIIKREKEIINLDINKNLSGLNLYKKQLLNNNILNMYSINAAKNRIIKKIKTQNIKEVYDFLKQEYVLKNIGVLNLDNILYKLRYLSSIKYNSIVNEEFDKLNILNNTDNLINLLSERIYKSNIGDPFELINTIFLEGLVLIINNDFNDFKRLIHRETRNYYSNFIKNKFKKSYSERIRYVYEAWKIKKHRQVFMGTSYGKHKFSGISDEYENDQLDAYINLDEESEESLFNLCIIKLEMEDSFINYKVQNVIECLYKLQKLNEDNYFMFKYGTTDEKNIRLLELGLSSNMINLLRKNEKIDMLVTNEFGNLILNESKVEEFKKFLETVDDLYRFEMSKYINF